MEQWAINRRQFMELLIFFIIVVDKGLIILSFNIFNILKVNLQIKIINMLYDNHPVQIVSCNRINDMISIM